MPTGILSKQAIEAAIDRGELILHATKANLQPCSYDLRIGTIFKNNEIINLDHDKHNGQFIVKPGEIIHVLTEEEVSLTRNIMATVFPRNSDSSEGLLVLNPGHIDPGYQGAITVTAVNLKKTPLTLQRGRKIFTIVFEEMPDATTSPYNKNISRQEREREFHEALVSQDTHNLSEVIIQGSESPYFTKTEVEEKILNLRSQLATQDDVKSIILSHWATWLSLIFTFIAAAASIVAVVVSMQPKSENSSNSTPIHLEKPNLKSPLK